MDCLVVGEPLTCFDSGNHSLHATTVARALTPTTFARTVSVRGAREITREAAAGAADQTLRSPA